MDVSGSTAVRRELYIITVAVLVATAVGSTLVLLIGESPARVYWLLLRATWGSQTGLGQVLFKATPLILTGLAVALGFRVGLFNIGGEGQLMVGCLFTAVVAQSLPLGTPAAVAVPLAISAGGAGGAMLGAIPGALRAYTGAHEVINTIMLNVIAASLVLWAGNRGLFIRDTRTAQIIDNATLPGLGLGASHANLSFVLALFCALLFWQFFARSVRGFEFRAAGLNADAARTAGINVKATVTFAMAASGGLAGLCGANYVLGYKHYFEYGVGRGVGFMGIAVALLGRNHPLGIVVAAVLLATLSQGGLAVSELVPKELVDVLQAVLILSVAAAAVDRSRRPVP